MGKDMFAIVVGALTPLGGAVAEAILRSGGTVLLTDTKAQDLPARAAECATNASVLEERCLFLGLPVVDPSVLGGYLATAAELLGRPPGHLFVVTDKSTANVGVLSLAFKRQFMYAGPISVVLSSESPMDDGMLDSAVHLLTSPCPIYVGVSLRSTDSTATDMRREVQHMMALASRAQPGLLAIEPLE